MSDLTYTVVLQEAGDKTFVMPSGFESNVTIYCWGAGGGGTIGASGGGGGYASTLAQIPAGAVVRLQVGQPGTNGDRRTGGIGGTHPSYTRYRGGSAGSAYDEDWDTGAGGGGGGASAVVIDDSPVCVGAGGGGAGGLGDDSNSGTPGNPGGVYPGSATNIYPVTLSYAWNSFMNSYAVWGAGQDYTVTLNFPVTGTYTFNYAVDNYGQVFLDGSSIISYAGFTATTTYTATVSAGNHTVRITGVNTGGPAGVAAQILKPDSSELWNTRALTVSGGLTATSDGGTSPNAWTSGGGGGGGYYGGEPGTSYGDDAGNAPGGNGGQNYGAVIEAGSGILPGGRTTTYYPTIPTNIGRAGYPGYIIMVFTRKSGLQIKDPDGSGNWITVNSSYVKVGSESTTSFTTETRTYTTAGRGTFTVPDGVTSLSVTALGGSGGGGGSAGVPVTQTLAVTPRSAISLVVGAGGSAGGSTSTTYASTSRVTYTVPAGVTSITISATGGRGGSGSDNGPVIITSYPGSFGSTVTQTIAVSAGDVISMYVGAAGGGGTGTTVAAYGGGGAGGNSSKSTAYNGKNGSSNLFGSRTVASGGGGASTVVELNGSIVIEAAGGQGGGTSSGLPTVAGGAGGPGSGSTGSTTGSVVITVPSFVTSGEASTFSSISAAGGIYGVGSGTGSTGSITVNYSIGATVSAWKLINEIWTKVDGEWKPISQRNSITLYNYK